MQFWEKGRSRSCDDHRTSTSVSVCLRRGWLTSFQIHVWPHAFDIRPTYLNGYYTVGESRIRVSALKNFVISFPDFRNRFTCVAVPGNREMTRLRLYYLSVGMPECHVSSWLLFILIYPFKCYLCLYCRKTNNAFYCIIRMINKVSYRKAVFLKFHNKYTISMKHCWTLRDVLIHTYLEHFLNNYYHTYTTACMRRYVMDDKNTVPVLVRCLFVFSAWRVVAG